MKSGEVYGYLTTVRELSERNSGHVVWECKCKCGNTTRVYRDRLISGHTKSCGCHRRMSYSPQVDLTGKEIGRLKVIEWTGTTKKGSYWLCECKCGNKKKISHSDLQSGRVISCGCSKIERLAKHNGAYDRLYGVWSAMKERCDNPNNKYYDCYGGRGIRVCNEWQDYSKFKEWSYANGYDEYAGFQECTIDRIDVNGNYEPSNCRYVNQEVQSNNKRVTIKVEMDGEIKSLKQWCEILGSGYQKARYRRNQRYEVKDWFDCELPYKVVRVV